MLASISSGGTATIRHETEYVKSGFTQESQSTTLPNTNLPTNILWGAAATAMLGATLADWQRKREEEEARKRAEAAAQAEKEGGSGKKTPGQRAYEKIMQQKRIVGALMAQKKDPIVIPSQKLEAEETNWLNKLNPVYQYEKRKEEKLQAQQAESQQARDDYRAGERGYAVQQAAEAGERQYDLTSWIVWCQKI